MSILLWPVAILVFLAWSLAAWIAYSLSDWLAGLVASAASGVLSAELGPWAQWLLSSMGDIIQIAIAVLWGIIGLLILWSPIWLRRRRRQGFMEGAVNHGQGLASEARNADRAVPRYEPVQQSYASGRASRGDEWRHGGWRDREAWRDRFSEGRRDLDDLRFLARDLADKYRSKKWKKRRHRDDDDD